MICYNCKKERKEKDFINNNKICYLCIYRIKTEKTREKRTSCRTCGKKVIQLENQKKRQRTVFCSNECAEKGHKNQINNHWTRKVAKDPIFPIFPKKRRTAKCKTNQK